MEFQFYPAKKLTDKPWLRHYQPPPVAEVTDKLHLWCIDTVRNSVSSITADSMLATLLPCSGSRVLHVYRYIWTHCNHQICKCKCTTSNTTVFTKHSK